MLGKFRAFRVAFYDSLMTGIKLKKLPKGWSLQPPGAISKMIGDEWVKSGRLPVLALPSVLVPLDCAYLLNPKHPDFGRIQIKDSSNFVLDPRVRWSAELQALEAYSFRRKGCACKAAEFVLIPRSAASS